MANAKCTRGYVRHAERARHVGHAGHEGSENGIWGVHSTRDAQAFVASKKQKDKVLLTTCTNPIIHLFNPLKICIGIVFDFPKDIFISQENLQTMIMQNFWGVKEVYYGIVQVVNKRKSRLRG